MSRADGTRGVLRTGLKIIAIVAGIALALEGGTRALGLKFPRIPRPQDAEAGDRSLWVYDASKGWFHRPREAGRVFLGGPDQGLVRLNNLGLRGGDVSTQKDPRTARVLVYGDSFVFGVGVDEEHAFSSQLERLLADRTERRYQVVNFGVSGYSTDQEYLLYQELGVSLQPDIVILVACDNDFDGILEDFAYQAYFKPYFELADGRLVPPRAAVPRLTGLQSARLWLGRRSNLWNGFRAVRFRPVSDLFQVARRRQSSTDANQLMRALLRAFRADVERAGARFVLLNTGHRGERTPLFQALRVGLREDGFDFLGLEGNLGEARVREPDRPWDFGRDVHWNVASHELAARVARNYLEKIGALHE